MHELDTIARRTLDSLDGERPSITKVAARAQARKRRRNMMRVGASGLVVLLVFLGGFLLLGSPRETTVDTAARPDPRSELSPEWDVVIFLAGESTSTEIAEVTELLDVSPNIGDFEVRGQQEVYDEFVEFFEGDRELLETITVESMPISISVASDDDEAPVWFALDDLPQVETIVAATGTIPRPIRVNGDPIFEIASSRRLFLGSIAGADQDFVRCMAAEGFEVSLLDGVRFFNEDYLTSLQNGDERALAEEWGFGLFSVNLLPSSPGSARVGPQEPRGLQEGDPYYDAAFGGFFGELGLFGGGCRGEADDLWRDGERQTPFEEIWQVTDLFVMDQRVIDHYSEFSRCITDRGLSATSPLDAYEQTGDVLTDLFSNDRPRAESEAALAEEIELAIATVDCGESTTDLVSPALRPVWEEYVPDGWDDNEFHIATPGCLGNAAYDLDLTALLTVEAAEALFPDSCFE